MAILYKFKNNEENIEKILSLGYILDINDGILSKKKKIKYDSDLVDFTRNIYNNIGWINMMKSLNINLENYGLVYEKIIKEDGSQSLILVENDDFRKKVVNFVLFFDLKDGILSLSGDNEIYPTILQSKEILDKYFKRDINKLKKLELIEEVEVSEEGIDL